MTLKALRDHLERNPDFHDVNQPFATPPMVMDIYGEMLVPNVRHDDAGMGFEVGDDWNVPWSWHEMVAQLDDASMRLVVCGPEGRSRGLVGCSFAVRPGSYDHKRSHMMRETTGRGPNVRLPIWDFVLHREDGSGIRLHPHWSRPHQPGRKNKSDPFVDSFDMDGHAEPVEVPRAGYGGSDGRGTYRWQLRLGNAQTLRFDGRKLQQR